MHRYSLNVSPVNPPLASCPSQNGRLQVRFAQTGRLKARHRPALLALVLVLALVLTASLSACSATGSSTAAASSGATGSGATGSTGATTASGSGATGSTAPGSGIRAMRFVTSLYPQYLAAAQIAKGISGVVVTSLTGTLSGCLHDYQLTTGNMKTLEQADAFIINGSGLEGYLETVARNLPKLKVIDASEGIELYDDNPHVWVSISLMIRQVENIARGMAAVEPQHKDAFERNAKAYIDRLTALRDKMHATLDPLPKSPIITVHEAFPYFAHEFGLEIAGVVEREPDSEPSAAELAATIRLIKEKNVRAVFAEPQYPATAAESIARESGVRLYTLDPASMGSLDNLDTYLEIMERNRQVLAEAFK